MLNKGISSAKACRLLIAASALSCATALGASAAYAQEAATTRQFNVSAQPLNRALLDLGRQAGISISASSDVTQGKRSRAVVGRMTARQALVQLLEGSGLTFEFVSESAVRVFLNASNRAGAPAALSESETDQSVQADIVVTGTNIRGARPQSAPLQTYSQDDIRMTGATTVEQFLGKVPQNFSSTVGVAPVGAFGTRSNAEAATGVDLRGLGPGTTLILLNGHRLAPAASSTTPDVSLIPLGALERIDLLTDGASAVYGADAVGGVANFVLRRDLNGAETNLSYGWSANGGGRQIQADQLLGKTWSSGGALASFTFFDRSLLDASRRSFSSSAAPFALLPEDRRYNGLVSIHQNILGGTFSADGMYTERRTSGMYRYSQFTDQRRSTQKQLFTDAAYTAGLFNDISATISGSYSRYTSDQDFARTSGTTVTDFHERSRSSTWDVSAKVDGTLLLLPGGNLRFSTGLGYTSEEYQPINHPTLKRRTRYAFGEILAPLISPANAIPFIDRLELSASARYTSYSGFGEKVSPRFGVAWSPAAPLTLRGSYSRSFRAPSLAQLDSAGNDFAIFPISLLGLPDPFDPQGNSVELAVFGSGNSSLRPETSRSFTLGLDVAPVGPNRFTAKLTYFNIRYSDRIAVPDPTQGFAAHFDPASYASAFIQNPTAAQIADAIGGANLLLNISSADPNDPASIAGAVDVLYDDRVANLSLSRLDGIDFDASVNLLNGPTTLRVGTTATYLLNYKQRVSPASAIISVLNTTLNPVDFRIVGYADLDTGSTRARLSVNYVNSYDNPTGPVGGRSVDSWTTLDLSLSQLLATTGPLRNTQLSLSIQNLLNTRPPFVAVGGTTNAGLNLPIGFDPTNANPLGRFVAVSIRKAW